MTTTRIARVSAALAAIALIPAGLAACSGGQSVEEACGIIQEDLTAASEELQSAFTEMTSGETGGENPLVSMSETLNATADKVTNEEVAEPYGKIVEGFDKVVPVFDALNDIDMNDPESISELEGMTAELEPLAGEMQEAGAQLEEVCGFESGL